MRYALIDKHRKEWSLKFACHHLLLSVSGYYRWRKRPGSVGHYWRVGVKSAIHQAYKSSRQTYGSPRIHAALKAQGVNCCENTVAKFMRQDGLKARPRRSRYKVKTTDSSHSLPVAENKLAREFERTTPNQAWVSDITYIPTDEGWLYLATTLDLYSRRIVGWSMNERMTSDLVIEALQMGIVQRNPPKGLMHHSDRGSQYASGAFQQMLAAHGMVCSMSRRGEVYDNAVMESFYATLKQELVHEARYATRDEARKAIFEWIEVFYNRQRLHSSLGYRSPADYEAAA
jgi:transposase InsO family protein